jgi:16S rRNA (guanine1516-N2)-methyltransferase
LNLSSNRPKQPGLALLATTAADEAVAARLAKRLALPLLITGSDPECCEEADAILVVNGCSVHLQQAGKGAPGPVAVDFGNAVMRHRRRAGHNELLGKAVGVGKKAHLRIMDATAGLGRDGFVLADLGCEVLLCEREPVVVELLRSGMDVASSTGDQWLATVLSRMRLYPGDAMQMAAGSLRGVDVIYLDPMFPQSGKSAAVKKEMALFQWLLDSAADPRDADELLRWALRQDVSRVVVKRPPRAPSLAALQPSHCISGKAVRYDVYVLSKPEGPPASSL